MKLIIDIPEKAYELLKSKSELDNIAESIIANGKPYEERPQGEWIKIFENPFTNGYVCPFCGHKIQVTEQFLPKVTECEVCGADMRGGST